MSEKPAPFTYPDVGATRAGFPAGYQRLRHTRSLGHGRALFEQAAAHIFAFGMQKGVGIFAHADTDTAEAGTELTIRLGVGPLGIVAPCRVVYVLHEPNRRGFAYGTLPGHPAIGEELFAVEYDPTDDSVRGLVTAFSRPGTWYTRVGGPVARGFQRWFAHRYLSTLPTGD
ncbi:DUF1990 family protein [Nocardia asteroides]|uniref:DUF1990 family protein n=1 Tax=Nocardia asteroides TaxID=1824 RepID=UPI0037CC3427